MNLFVPAPLKHRVETERLDTPELYPHDLESSLRDVRLVNRWLGGTRVALRFLRDRPELAPGASATLLDVATGTADIPLALAGWARRRGIELRTTVTDLNPLVIENARRHVGGRGGFTFEVANALELPYDDGSFDYVTCNLAFHHFVEGDSIGVLREMYRVARRAMLVNDLVRCRPGYYGARLIFLVNHNPLTSHDGPLSVLRSYTLSEVDELAREAGLRQFEITEHPMFRYALVAEKQVRATNGA